MASLPCFIPDSPDRITYPLADNLSTPRLVLGCMHFGGTWEPGTEVAPENRTAARKAIETALELGWTFFDHADIYCKGRSETLFGEFMQDAGIARDAITIQSKCGICLPENPIPDLSRWGDFSSDYIVNAAEGSLKRLKTDYLDILLLHRPDFLMETDEILKAFSILKETGKVREFGVSNFTPPLLDLVQAAGFTPVANQVEISIIKTSLLDSMLFSQGRQPSPGHPGDGTLEWNRRNGVVTQSWASLAYGYLSGRPQEDEDPRISNAARVVKNISEQHGVPREAIVIAWLLRHPAGIQPVIGTRDPDRLKACDEALKVNLSRKEWYSLYEVGRGTKVP